MDQVYEAAEDVIETRSVLNKRKFYTSEFNSFCLA